MCTCTYIPTKRGFLFAANRDETPSRAGIEVLKKKAGETAWYVKEPLAGGSNLGLNSQGRLVCLLNGAQSRKNPSGPFKKSRGLVVLDSLKFPSLEAFGASYSLEGVNAFTLIAPGDQPVAILSWDGKQKKMTKAASQAPHIWASPKLYTDYWQRRREVWLETFLRKRPDPTLETLLQFHSEGGDGNPEQDMVMNRKDKVCTVSLTGIEFQNHHWKIIHKDLILKTVTKRSI